MLRQRCICLIGASAPPRRRGNARTIEENMRPVILLISLMTCLAISGLAQEKVKNSDIENIGSRDINRGQINFISPEKELALGRQLAEELERQVKISDNTAVNEYIRR